VRRILVVDDEPLIREVLAEVFMDEGYAVDTAADSHEALAAIAAAPPDLLITDIMMPGLSGWDLLGRVRLQHPLLPILLISAGHRAVAGRSQYLADHTAFLAKPFAVDELLALVARLLGSPAS
jgi:two-component system response regulator MprA